MNFNKAVAVAVLTTSLSFSTVPMFAQSGDHRPDDRQERSDRDRHDDTKSHDDHRGPDHRDFVRHDDWKKGRRMEHADWNRGRRVDYKVLHLRKPPKGHEWRQVDGHYVLAAINTGVIFAVVEIR